MARKLALLAASAAGVCALLYVLMLPATDAVPLLDARAFDLETGRAMFNAGGCASCHAGRNDPLALGGREPLETPIGTFYAPNISPDPDDGIGRWSEVNFITAMTRGVTPDGRHYYPVFPYTSFQRMTVPDLRDLFAYLKILPPVRGKAPTHAIRFPFNNRPLLGLWKRLFLNGEVFRSDPTQSPEWNRGAYLVNGPGHCGECHTPRNFLSGLRSDQHLTGGHARLGEEAGPDITRTGIPNWSDGDVLKLLNDGVRPNGERVAPPMLSVVQNIAQLEQCDKEAIAIYLRSLNRPDSELPNRRGE